MKNFLNEIGVTALSKNEQKEILGKELVGTIYPNLIFKCYRNNSGKNFFWSGVDLSSATTVCYAESRVSGDKFSY